MPTLVLPESEATGASPGRLPSVWPGALGAPSPCSAKGSADGSILLRGVHTLSLFFEEFVARCLTAGRFAHVV